jgi:DNA-binding SARP family transcriptional activator
LLEFGILGPLRVLTDDDVKLTIRGDRQRILLASLLMRAGQPVSVEMLADYVWDERLPAEARSTLKSYVMRLRRQLGPQAGRRIRTRAPGYLIDAGDELDLRRFERLWREGRQAAASGAWERAAPVFGAALALWRGEPLADVPPGRLQRDECGRLAEARMTVTELWAEAELRAGRGRDLVPELKRLGRLHPYREGLHGLLMTALYVSGSRAEALSTFLAIRRRLAEEVGVDPGPQLSELHARILADDAALAAAAVGSSLGTVTVAAVSSSGGEPVPAAIPRQLPSAVPSFVGRRAELDMITRLAARVTAGAAVISTIDGMAGAGKTALAISAANRLAGTFPDGQLFVDLHGYTRGSEPRPPGEALNGFLRALGVSPQQIPEDPEERAALFRQRLAGTRTLILLDNAVSEAQVRPLLPGSAECLVMVTSRRRLKGLYDAETLNLGLLPRAEATALLRALAGPDRAAADDPVLAEIAGLCGRLPLALRIAGTMLRHRPAWTPAYLAGLLRDEEQRISTLSDGERDLDAVFELSYRSLPDAHQRLFRLLGLIPGPDLDACAAAALNGSDPGTATRLLEDLNDHNLLLQHAPGRYQLPDLIRLYARALSDQDPISDRDTALDRLLDYYHHTARRAALIARNLRPAAAGPDPARIPSLPDPETARAWLRAERCNLLAAFHQATAHAHHHHHYRVVALTAGLNAVPQTDGPLPTA